MLNSNEKKQILFVRGQFKAKSWSAQKWSLYKLTPELQYSDHKQGNFVFNADDTISVPKTGYYKISGTYCITGYGNVQGLMITQYNSDLSTASHIGGELHQGNGSFNFGHCETITRISAGEKIAFNVYADANGTMTVNAGPDRQGSFIIEYLGGVLRSIICLAYFLACSKERRRRYAKK